MKNIQISLKAARVNAGLTLEDVAKSMMKSKQTIINWEKGRSVPSVPDMEYMVKLYGIPQDNIFLQSYSTKSR